MLGMCLLHGTLKHENNFEAFKLLNKNLSASLESHQTKRIKISVMFKISAQKKIKPPEVDMVD